MPEHRLVHFVGGPLGGMVKWTDETEWWDCSINHNGNWESEQLLAIVQGYTPTFSMLVTHYELIHDKTSGVAVMPGKPFEGPLAKAHERESPEFLEQARLELFDRFNLPADDMSDADVLDAYNRLAEHGVCPFTRWPEGNGFEEYDYFSPLIVNSNSNFWGDMARTVRDVVTDPLSYMTIPDSKSD